METLWFYKGEKKIKFKILQFHTKCFEKKCNSLLLKIIIYNKVLEKVFWMEVENSLASLLLLFLYVFFL